MNPDDPHGSKDGRGGEDTLYGSTREPLDVGWLSDTIEKRVIPELARACERYFPDGVAPVQVKPLPDQAFQSVLKAILRYDSKQAIRIVDTLIEDRVPMQVLYLSLFAPAARRIGELWEDDQLDFLEVTQALAAIQLVLHHMSESAVSEPTQYDSTRRILIARAPGEQHIFGVLTVSEFFRLGGWEVEGGIGQEADDSLLDLVNERWFALIGLSAATDGRIAALTEVIPRIRAASKNRRLGVMVGGPAFIENASLFEAVGADAMATDADQAVGRAEDLLAAAFRGG
ncbi:MAG: cobalamin B12-binding domain-containing protein [Marivibrio sp.]|uniref:cobalamin B12-binding domain-containing protein n=1 Tax=Marivibrio sp. TaxID=2039719 RepID=UPI0032F01607